MSLDGLFTRAITQEIANCTGGRIHKIHQPTEHDIVLQIRAQGTTYKLLLSANPTYPRVHFTNEAFANPIEAPMFCMLLRKHCEGAIIEGIHQIGMERMIRIDVRQRDEIGDLSQKSIIVELMGRHSNIILIDPASGGIVDGIHHVTPAISSYRIVMPGNLYVMPPEQGKSDPLLTNQSTFMSIMAQPSPSAHVEFELEANPNAQTEQPALLQQTLVDRFSGISPLIAKEIEHRCGYLPGIAVNEVNLSQVWNNFSTIMKDVQEQRIFPHIVTNEITGKSFFSVVELTHIPGESNRYPTVSECLEAYFGDKAERDTVKQRTADMTRFLINEKNKNIKKLDKLHETVEEAKDADKYRIKGELLTSSIHLAKKGMKEIEVLNYYEEDQRMISIELDPQLTPAENAQRLFRKYTKSKNSLTVVNEQITSTLNEIVYLDTILQQLSHAGVTDISEIREELVQQGYIRDRSKKTKKKKKTTEKPLLTTYTSSEGFTLYVGKNNNQNEYLTNRLASPNDTWLHTKDIPGSHVVIRGTDFNEQTLNEAAHLAAYYSQAKSSSQVPVDFTLIRHVKKPNGSKPGFVIYEQQKTLFITPDEKLIKQMPVVVK